ASVGQGARAVCVYEGKQILERGARALGCETLGALPSRGLSLERVLDRPLGIFGLCGMDEQQGVEAISFLLAALGHGIGLQSADAVGHALDVFGRQSGM